MTKLIKLCKEMLAINTEAEFIEYGYNNNYDLDNYNNAIINLRVQKHNKLKEIEKELLKNKHNKNYINVQDKKDGGTALMYATCTNFDTVELLLQFNPDLNIINNFDDTVFDIAEFTYKDNLKINICSFIDNSKKILNILNSYNNF